MAKNAEWLTEDKLKKTSEVAFVIFTWLHSIIEVREDNEKMKKIPSGISFFFFGSSANNLLGEQPGRNNES